MTDEVRIQHTDGTETVYLAGDPSSRSNAAFLQALGVDPKTAGAGKIGISIYRADAVVIEYPGRLVTSMDQIAKASKVAEEVQRQADSEYDRSRQAPA